jgi:hypothetical protein
MSLKRNAAYAGREEELMRSVGLERVQIALPIPLLKNQGFYREPEASSQGSSATQSPT